MRALPASTSITTAGSKGAPASRSGSHWWTPLRATQSFGLLGLRRDDSDPSRATEGHMVLHGPLQLADGDITLQGPDPAGFEPSVFAVTGGRGASERAGRSGRRGCFRPRPPGDHDSPGAVRHEYVSPVNRTKNVE
jgi:hypothetical protein